eukprot:s3018_g7.t1
MPDLLPLEVYSHPLRPAQPRGPDPSGQRRTSTASSRVQWAAPDLNREPQIPVGNAGPQLRAPDRSEMLSTNVQILNIVAQVGFVYIVKQYMSESILGHEQLQELVRFRTWECKLFA